MDARNRAMPHLVLAIFTALAIGAVILSLFTAPANAQEQMRTAAKDTVAAGSFVITDTETSTTSPPHGAAQSASETAHFVYRAPDQVEETLVANGKTVALLVLGSARYERSGSGPWQEIAPQDAQVPTGSQAARSLLEPLEVLTTAVDVVSYGDRYGFEPADRSLFLSELLGPNGAGLPVSATTFGAVVSGEYLSEVDLGARTQGAEVRLRLRIGSFDQAPTLVAPIRPGR